MILKILSFKLKDICEASFVLGSKMKDHAKTFCTVFGLYRLDKEGKF